MQERIFDYSNVKEIHKIIETNFKEHFYFVRHNHKTHQLHFKSWSEKNE
jgi:hypothetical protein